jgi:hypothetical protein
MWLNNRFLISIVFMPTRLREILILILNIEITCNNSNYAIIKNTMRITLVFVYTAILFSLIYFNVLFLP